MNINVIIPTFNRARELESALNSILKQTLLPSEVIIIDQSENTATKDLVESFDRTNQSCGVRFIWHYQREKGSAKARNVGARLAKGEIICFTDDDVVLQENYFAALKSYFDKYSHIGGICGNVEVPNPPSGFKWFLRRLLLRVFLIDFGNGKMTPSGFGFPIFQREIEGLTYVELVAGYSMNFRRQFIENDMFDEFFTGYSFREDVELSYRISRKTQLALIPEARFQHNTSPTNRINLEPLKRMQFRNYYYVFNKHRNVSWVSLVLFGYSIFGILFMGFVEWLFGFKKKKWDCFASDASAVLQLIRGEL